MKDLKVKVGPQFYMYNQGALDFVVSILKEYGVNRVLIVHGTISWEKAKLKLNFIKDKNFNFFYHQYTGECSYFGAELIKKIVKQEGIDFIIGVGGGKLTDLVGYSANICNVDYGVIPTLASNCAPWTPLSVMYKENGESEGKTEHYLRQSAFFITDPELIIDAPIKYFVAGLADTLAKWYESESILMQKHLINEPFLNLAQFTAKLCKEAIMKNSSEAIEAMREKKITDKFIHLSEIIFAVAGLVGGLGDKYARNAVAHAMHDALSKYVPQSHQFLHGEIVAYGILFQLALEEKWLIIDQLIPFYKNLRLPISLDDMNIQLDSSETRNLVINFIESKEKVHLLPINITKVKLSDTINSLEEYSQRNK